LSESEGERRDAKNRGSEKKDEKEDDG